MFLLVKLSFRQVKMWTHSYKHLPNFDTSESSKKETESPDERFSSSANFVQLLRAFLMLECRKLYERPLC